MNGRAQESFNRNDGADEIDALYDPYRHESRNHPHTHHIEVDGETIQDEIVRNAV